jgi:hypothetical protein
MSQHAITLMNGAKPVGICVRVSHEDQVGGETP